jgi:hypothetical protein
MLLLVRVGGSVSFGSTHWVLRALTVLLVGLSTLLTGVLTSTGVCSFFIGHFLPQLLSSVVPYFTVFLVPLPSDVN